MNVPLDTVRFEKSADFFTYVAEGIVPTKQGYESLKEDIMNFQEGDIECVEAIISREAIPENIEEFQRMLEQLDAVYAARRKNFNSTLGLIGMVFLAGIGIGKIW